MPHPPILRDRPVAERVRSALKTDGPFWRSLARWGAEHAPMPVVRYSPPLWALCFAACLPKVRRQIRSNLRKVRGARPWAEEQADVLRTFASFASCLTEAFAQNRPDLDPPRHTVSGREHLEAAMSRGRGLILLTAHTGMWDAAGPLLKELFSIDLLVAMQGEPNEASRRIQDEARQRGGVRVVHVGADPFAVLPLVAHLRRGGSVGMQIDRVPPEMKTLPVRFFGHPWHVPRGPFELARAVGAPIVPVFTWRRSFFDYEFKLFSPIVLERRARTEAMARGAQLAVTALEGFIREHPTQWFHFVPEAPERSPGPLENGGYCPDVATPDDGRSGRG